MKTARKVIQRAALAAIVLAALLQTSGAALAQQFEKVENIPKQEIPAGRFVGIAYGIIWLAVLTYVLFVAGGLKRVNQEIADLKRKVGGGGTGTRG
jgi:CcmD family protein